MIAAVAWPPVALIALGALVLFIAATYRRGEHSEGRYDRGDYAWVNNILGELPPAAARWFYGLVGLMLVAGGVLLLLS